MVDRISRYFRAGFAGAFFDLKHLDKKSLFLYNYIL